ncbi:MAG: hypothetical protein ACOYL6_15230 [Bacteriovoracaceae bacterium]
MKKLILGFALALSATSSFATALDCTYQVMARFSERSGKFDIDKNEGVIILSDKRVLIDAIGNNSNKKYKLLLETKNMVNGTSLSFSVYENFKLEGTGFTGKALATTIGLFGADQKELQLQTLTPDTIMNIFCTQNP